MTGAGKNRIARQRVVVRKMQSLLIYVPSVLSFEC
jgi:hypothetical protein